MINNRGMPPRSVVATATLSVGLFAIGLSAYCIASPPYPLANLLWVQLGGGFQALPLPSGTKSVILADIPFIVCYLLSFWIAASLAPVVGESLRGARLRRWTRALTVVTVTADGVENLLILRSLDGALVESEVRATLNLVTHAAVLKFLCFFPAMLAAGAIVVAAVVALVRRRLASIPERPTGSLL